MKITPMETLEIVLCFSFLYQLIFCFTRLTAYRFKCQGEWKDAGLGHIRLGFFQNYPFTEKQNRIPKKY